MKKSDQAVCRRAVGTWAISMILLAVFMLLGSKCGGKVECQRLPDGTFSCSVETHRH